MSRGTAADSRSPHSTELFRVSQQTCGFSAGNPRARDFMRCARHFELFFPPFEKKCLQQNVLTRKQLLPQPVASSCSRSARSRLPPTSLVWALSCTHMVEPLGVTLNTKQEEGTLRSKEWGTRDRPICPICPTQDSPSPGTFSLCAAESVAPDADCCLVIRGC